MLARSESCFPLRCSFIPNLFLGLVELPAGIGLLDGDRVAGKLDNDGDRLVAHAERCPGGCDKGGVCRRGHRAHGAGIRRRQHTDGQYQRGERAHRHALHMFSSNLLSLSFSEPPGFLWRRKAARAR